MSKDEESGGRETATQKKYKIGEIFQDEDGNHSINCFHCLLEDLDFSDFTLHIIQGHCLQKDKSLINNEIAYEELCQDQDDHFEDFLIKVESDNCLEDEGLHPAGGESRIVDHLTCSVCKQKFDKIIDLNNHFELKHTLVQPNSSQFECKICSKSFNIYHHFRTHICAHKRNADERLIEQALNKLDDCSDTLECNQKSKLENLTCGICGWTSKKRKHLLEHQRRHVDNRVACEMCGKMVTANNMRGHMEIHTNTADHLCAICGKSFIKKGLLTLHLLVHNKTLRHKCEFCSKQFHRSDRLLVHYRTKHKSKLNFYCRTCNAGYMNRKSLIRHENIHLTKANDEVNTQFRCAICNTGFKKKVSLQEHNKYIHPE